MPVALNRCDLTRRVPALAGDALGTSWQVRYVAARDTSASRLRAAIEQRLALIVDQMSQWEPHSLLSRFNRAPAGTWFSLPPDFATVISAALDVAERSGGAFDPTLGRAASLLGYGAEAVGGKPSATELEEARATAGWRRVEFDPAARRLRQPGGLWLDFSGIAKGYAVDAVADLLRSEGIEDALVEIGGELAGRGLRPDGQPWWVDLEAPPGVRLSPIRIGLHEIAVATSGDYVRGAHTLDPGTGRPVRRGVGSVSVIHDRAMHADAWATALTVLGSGEGMALAMREGLVARMVSFDDDEATETLSPALRVMIEG